MAADLLQPAGGAGKDQLGFQIELGPKLPLPLLRQVRWTQNGQPLNLAPIEEFPGDQAGLDGLSDADVIGDEQADRIEP